MTSTNIRYILKRKATLTHTELQVLIINSTLSTNLKEKAVSSLFSYLYTVFLLLNKGAFNNTLTTQEQRILHNNRKISSAPRSRQIRNVRSSIFFLFEMSVCCLILVVNYVKQKIGGKGRHIKPLKEAYRHRMTDMFSSLNRFSPLQLNKGA